jgi:hypothetical protein
MRNSLRVKVCSFDQRFFRLNTSRLISIVGFLISVVSFGQPERQAMANLEKGKWEKARGGLVKALRKDSLNTVARFAFSTYYFSPGNPAYNIDSAYRYAHRALAAFKQADPKQRERMKKLPLDSTLLISRREAIEGAAFDRAKKLNTEHAYLFFIEKFPHASELERAGKLRDEVAYLEALNEDTYEGYFRFLSRYPNALRAQEARDRYEKLLYETKTKDRKLISYRTFIDQYPASPYRQSAELQVFEISTASGRPETFMAFLNAYPASNITQKARNILYHILKEEETNIPAVLLTDSIRTLRQLEQDYLVPFFSSGKFGFMDTNGEEVIAPFIEELSREYRCGNIREELLVGDSQVVARNGAVVYDGRVNELEDLGYGYLLADRESCAVLLHKSGFIVDDCVGDARVLAGSMLAVKKDERWTIRTLTGRALPLGEFELVESMDNVLAVRQDGKFRLIHMDEAAKTADQQAPVFSRAFDEVKRLSNHAIWVREGDQQGLLEMDLKAKIGLEKQEILYAYFGAVIRSAGLTSLWNPSVGESDKFQSVEIQQPWIAVRRNGSWQLLDQRFNAYPKVPFDSLFFSGPFAVGVKHDSIHVYVTAHTFVPLRKADAFQFLPGRDSVYFLMVDEKEGKTIYNPKGEKLFTVNADRIDYAGENLFIITRREKRGLINLQGKVVVQPGYDAMGNLDKGTVPVLKDKKFGFLDVANRREIKPAYEKNLVAFSPGHLIAFKGGTYGIINWANKPVIPFEYEEIRYWNDSTALVKKNFQWIIYNFVEKKVIADRIKSFTWLMDTPDEKLIIFHQESHYGVLSNRKGIILPATYSDIVNLGSGTKPLYFTEKHVEEASIYVVIYYNEQGKLLRRQVFEIDDYERIYCSDH